MRILGPLGTSGAGTNARGEVVRSCICKREAEATEGSSEFVATYFQQAQNNTAQYGRHPPLKTDLPNTATFPGGRRTVTISPSEGISPSFRSSMIPSGSDISPRRRSPGDYVLMHYGDVVNFARTARTLLWQEVLPEGFMPMIGWRCSWGRGLPGTSLAPESSPRNVMDNAVPGGIAPFDFRKRPADRE